MALDLKFTSGWVVLAIEYLTFPNFLFQAGGAGGVQAALTKLATTGCDVAITELDIKGASSKIISFLRSK
jgi:hypothetical protein